MAQINEQSTEENERQPETSGDNDENLKVDDEIRHVRDEGLVIETTTLQSLIAENSAHLEQTSQRPGDELGYLLASRIQKGRSFTSRDSSSRCTGGAISAVVETRCHSNQSATGGDQSWSLGDLLLNKIRDKMLFDLGAPTEDVLGLNLINRRPFAMSIMVKDGKKVDLDWLCKPGTMPEKVAGDIRNAWPRNRNLEGMTQIILESDGITPVSKVPWQSVGEDFQHQYDSLGWRLNALEARDHAQWFARKNHVRFSAYESLWHQWCLDAAESAQSQRDRSSLLPSKFGGQMIYCSLKNFKNEERLFPLDQLASVLSYDEPFLLPPCRWDLRFTYCFHVGRLLSFLRPDFQGGWNYEVSDAIPSFIHWQIRYFRPIDASRALEAKKYPCLLGDRQRAMIGRGSATKYLEEKRARVSLRLFDLSHGLFNITVLADDDMSPREEDWNENRERQDEAAWVRYGLKPCGKGTPITHYLFEVSRIFGRSIEAWDDALDSIDELVHVNLNDFQDEKRVQDLMFDESFTRSKDYFVALQLLRIMDEWVDEILPSIEDLRDSPAMKHAIFCAEDAEDNFKAAIKSMKERADKFQKRLRKKSEEINSLRDGLFNATSLREATKAMALNQAIYVFTVVTVLFTPVSFLATFWALPFLNNPAEEGSDMIPEPASFRSSFVVMPVLTYALVIGIAWYMRPDKSRYRLPDWLVTAWDNTGKALNSAWTETRRIQRRPRGRKDAEWSI